MILLENGDNILLEDGKPLLMENYSGLPIGAPMREYFIATHTIDFDVAETRRMGSALPKANFVIPRRMLNFDIDEQ